MEAHEAQPVAPAHAPPPAPPPTFALTQQFDEDTHRLIIEARDPVSGIVAFQVPAKSAIKTLTDNAAGAGTRGQRVNHQA